MLDKCELQLWNMVAAELNIYTPGSSEDSLLILCVHLLVYKRIPEEPILHE